MDNSTVTTPLPPFPSIKTEILDRLTKEADERTMRPKAVNWDEIHRQAALARANS